MITNQSNNNAINSVKMAEIFGHFNNCVITYYVTIHPIYSVIKSVI